MVVVVVALVAVAAVVAAVVAVVPSQVSHKLVLKAVVVEHK